MIENKMSKRQSLILAAILHNNYQIKENEFK